MPDFNSFDDLSFIYHPDDLDFARHLAAQLTARGIRCWLDENEYGDSEASRQRLMDGILRCYTVALVLTPSSAQSQLCNALVEFAVINGKRFVTLIVNEEITVDAHPAIRAYPYMFFREQDEFEESFAALCDFLPADDHLRFHTELLAQAQRWDRQGRAPALLLAPERIDQARSWLTEGARRSPKPSQLQVEYIHASRRQKPTPKRSFSKYLIAGFALAAVVVALGIAWQGFAENQANATATAEFRGVSAAQTRSAFSAEATETAQSNSSARLLADLAATSGSIARQVRGTAEAEILRATSQSEQTLTAVAQATRLASNQRLTEIARSDRRLAARSVLESAEAALKAGDVDLALGLAWEIVTAFEEPFHAYPLLWRIATPAPRMRLEGAEVGAALERSGEALLVLDAGESRLLEIDSGIDLASIPQSRLARMNASGSHFAVYDSDGIGVYDARSGERLSQWQIEINNLEDFYLSPNGDALVIAGTSDALFLLRAGIDEPQRLNAGALGPPILVRFADDSAAFLTVHGERALLWDGGGAAPRRAYPLGAPVGFSLEERFDAHLSPAGDRLLFFVLLDNGLAGLTEITLGADSLQRSTFVHVAQGSLSPNGESLVLAYLDRAIEIVDAVSGETRQRIEHNESGLQKPLFVAAANRVYAMADSRLLIYDIRSGALEREIEHERELVDFSINDAGDVALTVDADGVRRVWQIESAEQLLRRIEADLEPRELTCEERAQYHTLQLCAS